MRLADWLSTPLVQPLPCYRLDLIHETPADASRGRVILFACVWLDYERFTSRQFRWLSECEPFQLLLNGGCEHMSRHCLREHSSIQIPLPGFTIKIEVAGVLGKGFIQKTCNAPGIIDLQGIKFRPLSWIKRMRFEIHLEQISVFFGICSSLDHGNLQLQDLIRLETNAQQSCIRKSTRWR